VGVGQGTARGGCFRADLGHEGGWVGACGLPQGGWLGGEEGGGLCVVGVGGRAPLPTPGSLRATTPSRIGTG